MAIVLAILFVLYILGILIAVIVFLGVILFLGIIAAVIVIGILSILLIPFYLLAKEPVVEEGGDYRIENIGDKDDWSESE
ncbi:MAG: hypothetical protein KAU99_01085 [Thermoplasmata archaeon]|nr:hypothetical protein [Thermoplasmata archaeon]